MVIRVQELPDGEELVVESGPGKGSSRGSPGAGDRGSAACRSASQPRRRPGSGGEPVVKGTPESSANPPATDGLTPLARDRASSVADEGGCRPLSVEALQPASEAQQPAPPTSAPIPEASETDPDKRLLVPWRPLKQK